VYWAELAFVVITVVCVGVSRASLATVCIMLITVFSLTKVHGENFTGVVDVLTFISDPVCSPAEMFLLWSLTYNLFPTMISDHTVTHYSVVNV